MYLKSLALQGFKSFPERTVIEYHNGVTAIVGPNGSGKSNITDAVRWVLGEQSVKTLRGGQMEDVIFNGTEQRRAMGFAEVSITLDNSDHALPTEFDEVEITRRLFRSGESEYMINRTNCRLKDIVRLFMDTGLGRDGYSIIGQGQVDHILSNKSEDRRKIFEEAAGIQKYKSRRDESVRKLEHAEQNLTRVTDILTELEAQLGPLSRQAEKARKWLTLTAELKGIEVAAILQRIDDSNAELKKLLDQDKLLVDDRKQAEADLQRLEADQASNREAIDAIEDRLQELRAEQAGLREQIADLNARISICDEREKQLADRMLRDGVLTEDAMRAVEKLTAEVEEQNKSVDALTDELEAQRKTLAELQQKRNELGRRLATSDEEARRLAAEQQSWRDKENQEQREQIRIQTQIELQKQKLASEERDLALLQAGQKEQEEAAKATEAELEETRRQLASDLKALEYSEAHLKEAELERNTSQADLQRLEQELSNASYRLKTLRDLEDNLVGYSDSVKNLLKLVKGRRPELQEKVRGTIGALLDVPGKYELAIETALGGAIHNIVVEDDRVASELIGILKKERMGRATFLPISVMKGRRIPVKESEGLARFTGYIGTACDLISFPAELTGIVEQLLGRILIADDLDHALILARRTDNRYRIVTHEGDVLNIGGSLTGGYNKKRSSGLLGRSREIVDLGEKIPGLKAGIEDARSYLEDLNEQLKTLAEERAELERRVTWTRQQEALTESKLEAMVRQSKDQEARVAETRRQLDETAAGLARDESELVERGEAVRRCSEALLRLDDQIREQADRGTRERREYEECSQAAADFNAVLQAREESLRGARLMAGRLQSELDEKKRQVEEYGGSAARLEDDRARNQAEKAEAESSLSTAGEALRQSAGRLEVAEREKHGLHELNDEHLKADRRVRDTLSRIDSELVRLDNRIQNVEAKQGQDKNYLWETYELTYLNADEWRREGLDMPKVEAEIIQLRQRVRNLGSVNVNAVEEFEQMNQRFVFMTEQQEDILKSKRDLNNVIRELTHAMREQFSENFRSINQNFKQTFAELFGGGEGEILLVNSDDVLTADIEIRVCPPGKKLQNMMLLSGGERCLTAISLLFAILKLRPTPFCIMDEVEAALDDSNIFRFTDYIRKYSDRSQFILVTHRKGTMEAADRMYGVTMSERGVSKILSMKLSD